jgi:hypothetical protein
MSQKIEVDGNDFGMVSSISIKCQRRRQQTRHKNERVKCQ